MDTATTQLRRLERDLHDGAQARLVALGMSLRAEERLIPANPGAAAALLAEARETSLKVLAELRDLVRGIHPPVLADRGLADAVRALALATPIRTEVDIDLAESPAADRVGLLLRGRRGADQRGQAQRARHAMIRTEHRDRRRCGSTSPTTASAAPTRERGTGLARHRAAARPHSTARPDGRQSARRTDDRLAMVLPCASVLAEDLALLRDGLIRLLEAHDFDVVEAVDNGPSLLRALTTHRPDVAVVDVRLPPTFTDEGLRAAIEARAQVPGLPVLVLSQYVEQLYARELLADRSGGVGYLLKDRVFNVGQFVDAVRQVAARRHGDGPGGRRAVAHRRAADEPIAHADRREREVLELMAEGRSNAADRGADVHHREGGQQAHQRASSPGSGCRRPRTTTAACSRYWPT